MNTYRFEITITTDLSEDEVADKVSDAIGSFADEDPAIDDFDIVALREEVSDETD